MIDWTKYETDEEIKEAILPLKIAHATIGIVDNVDQVKGMKEALLSSLSSYKLLLTVIDELVVACDERVKEIEGKHNA